MALTTGLVQVYTGDGKGKTTAAIGQAVRALGQGQRVLLARFLKPEEPPSGEVLLLQTLPGVEILTAGVGVLDGTTSPEEVAASVAATLASVHERLAAGVVDLVILDEINNALHRGALSLAELRRLLAARPATVEMVLTGRHAHPELIAVADLVTLMTAAKHPYQQGLAARRGIEY